MAQRERWPWKAAGNGRCAKSHFHEAREQTALKSGSSFSSVSVNPPQEFLRSVRSPLARASPRIFHPRIQNLVHRVATIGVGSGPLRRHHDGGLQARAQKETLRDVLAAAQAIRSHCLRGSCEAVMVVPRGCFETPLLIFYFLCAAGIWRCIGKKRSDVSV